MRRQGELVWDVSKALVKLGGRGMKGRWSSRWTHGDDGCATNFVRSFVLSLSHEKLVRTKDRKNSYRNLNLKPNRSVFSMN
jgi:hypothetical protein